MYISYVKYIYILSYKTKSAFIHIINVHFKALYSIYVYIYFFPDILKVENFSVSSQNRFMVTFKTQSIRN